MERVLSQDERIRRAEEIYARRKNVRERTSRATVNISSSQPKNLKLFKRLALQALICMLLYFIFYLINTTNYSFSKSTLDKTEELITQEVDFISIYNRIADTVSGYISNLNLAGNNDSSDGAITEGNITTEDYQIMQTNEINQSIENNSTENIIESSEVKKAGSENIAMVNNDEDTSQEEVKNIELSEADRIKQKYSFIIPVKRMGFFRIWRKGAII